MRPGRAGSQRDPGLVERCIAILGEQPAGSLEPLRVHPLRTAGVRLRGGPLSPSMTTTDYGFGFGCWRSRRSFS